MFNSSNKTYKETCLCFLTATASYLAKYSHFTVVVVFKVQYYSISCHRCSWLTFFTLTQVRENTAVTDAIRTSRLEKPQLCNQQHLCLPRSLVEFWKYVIFFLGAWAQEYGHKPSNAFDMSKSKPHCMSSNAKPS